MQKLSRWATACSQFVIMVLALLVAHLVTDYLGLDQVRAPTLMVNAVVGATFYFCTIEVMRIFKIELY